jgi:hypothetical protein
LEISGRNFGANGAAGWSLHGLEIELYQALSAK